MEPPSRDQELADALEQQRVTGEILRVISSSPTDIQPVFDMIARSAARLCKARFCQVFRFDGELIHFAAHHGLPAAAVEDVLRTYPTPPGRASATARAIANGAVAQIPDIHTDPDYARRRFAEIMAFRSIVAVPIMRHGRPIGAIAMGRSESGHFPAQQITLLQTFSDEAVIAIENVRLFNELERRNRDLTEAFEQQTATSEILRAISQSPTDVQPVFDTIAAAAMRLCGATSANVFTFDGKLLHAAAIHVIEPGGVEAVRRIYPRPPDRGTAASRAVLARRVVAIPDVLDDSDYAFENAPQWGFRSVLAVPLMRESTPIGAMALGRSQPGPFPEKQIALLQTFADQAVIAVENARLFDEIQDKTRQLELANTYKSRFLAAASHDLRQPLHALNLFVAQLHAESDPAERSRLVARIDAAVSAMNELFNALLDMSKLDAGVLEVDLTAFPVERLLKQMETTFAEAARERGLRLSVSSSRAWVRSDFILLERILLNLVSNAVRYTARGGIVIGCHRRGERLRLDVRDSGPGIPEDQQRNIFREFYQLAGPEQGRRGGLGLGLAIVDRLCRLLDYPVEVASTPGKGSRFSISVPLAAERPGLAGAPASTATIADPVAGKLIIVIDDDALVLDGMRGILRSWGCSVVGAASDTAALAQLHELGRRPDAIVSDYRLAGGKTGIEAVERLRSAIGAATPAFLISGDTSPERLRDAKASGFQLLHKPVPPMTLRAMLNRLIKAPTNAGETARAARR